MGPRLRALPSRSARRFGAGAGRAWIAPNVVEHQSVPNERHEQRAEDQATPWTRRRVRCQGIVWRPATNCVDRRPATRPYSVRLFARHHVLQKPGQDREDRAAGAAADDLANDGSDIEAAPGRACDRWHRG
jgi:hypothetical protein